MSYLTGLAPVHFVPAPQYLVLLCLHANGGQVEILLVEPTWVSCAAEGSMLERLLCGLTVNFRRSER